MATLLRSAVLVFVMLGAGSACGHSPTSPSPPSLAGTWVGTGFFTGGSTTVHLVQTGSALSGTWTSTQSNPDTGETMPAASGPVSGSVNGTSVSLSFGVDGLSATDCTFPIAVSATLAGEQLTGTYGSPATCSFRLSGNIVLTRASR